MTKASRSSNLAAQMCKEYATGKGALAASEISRLLKQVKGWKQSAGAISKSYAFEDFYETIAFVNAVAWIANQQNHHPDLEVSYNKCVVKFSTHSAGGLTKNDFICAARVNALG